MSFVVKFLRRITGSSDIVSGVSQQKQSLRRLVNTNQVLLIVHSCTLLPPITACITKGKYPASRMYEAGYAFSRLRTVSFLHLLPGCLVFTLCAKAPLAGEEKFTEKPHLFISRIVQSVGEKSQYAIHYMSWGVNQTSGPKSTNNCRGKTHVLFTGHCENQGIGCVVFVSVLIATLLLNTLKGSWARETAVRRGCVSLCSNPPSRSWVITEAQASLERRRSVFCHTSHLKRSFFCELTSGCQNIVESQSQEYIWIRSISPK